MTGTPGLPRRVLGKARRSAEALWVAATAWTKSAQDYSDMQRSWYDRHAAETEVVPGDLVNDSVVGTWQDHDTWADYEEYLMRYVPPEPTLVALDFGCGPGRNIRRWSDRFARIDGADIGRVNLENARTFLRGQIPDEKWPQLFLTSGTDCGDAPSASYDFAFSTICLQHISSWTIRFSILSDLYRVLRPGGRISFQMGYGTPSPRTVGYYDDYFAARATNRYCDVAVASPDQVGTDLERIGFRNVEHWIRPVGPGDYHPNWIFVTAIKPE